MNPEDVAAADLAAGDLVTIASKHGSIPAIVEPYIDVRPGHDLDELRVRPR
jgi:anaerobic selenocysteine-containing dehydrogenase